MWLELCDVTYLMLLKRCVLTASAGCVAVRLTKDV